VATEAGGVVLAVALVLDAYAVATPEEVPAMMTAALLGAMINSSIMMGIAFEITLNANISIAVAQSSRHYPSHYHA
jgi:hypothetical protein